MKWAGSWRSGRRSREPENNRPELALEAARKALGSIGLRCGEDVEVLAAPRGECSGWFEV